MMFIKNHRRLLPMFLWMGTIFAFSAQPSHVLPSIGVWDLLFKKGAHFGAYAILALLVFRGLPGVKRPFLLAFIITLLYAVSDEFHQTFVPGRNGTVIDVLIDTAGGLAGLVILYRVRFRQKQMQSPMPMSDRP